MNEIFYFDRTFGSGITSGQIFTEAIDVTQYEIIVSVTQNDFFNGLIETVSDSKLT